MAATQTGPHEWTPTRWVPLRCVHCYAPRKLHPRTGWVRARPLGDKRYLSADAPHFKEGW